VNAIIYCSVLKGFSHRKLFHRVWEVHDEMRQQKLQYSIVTYNTLIDACIRSGEMTRIAALLELMASDNIRPNVITHSTVLKGYCQDNRVDKAFEVLEDMKRCPDFAPDEVTYNTLLDGCARHGMLERGLELLKDMEASNVTPSNFTLSVVVKLANRSKQPDKGFELCYSLSRKYNIRLNMHVYNNLIHASTAHGNLPRALDVFKEMLSAKARPDNRTYTLLLRALIDAASATEAAGLLRASTGLPGVPQWLTQYKPAALQPKGGMSDAVIVEVLEGIADACHSEGLALQLFRELRGVAGISLDPKLPMRLASRAISAPASAGQ